MCRIAIVAAMQREVAPLVRGWSSRRIEEDGRSYLLFENGDVALICSGIGREAARRATEAVIRQRRPGHVVSVGFAGALNPSLRVGDICQPRVIVNAADGARTVTGLGSGTLVSFAAVAGVDQKQRLAKAYSADAVDMEAAAVAQQAQANDVVFSALKAISDEAEFVLPPTERFVSGDGQFQTASFVAHVAVRPWLWRRTFALARNSTRASRALCAALENFLQSETANQPGCNPVASC